MNMKYTNLFGKFTHTFSPKLLKFYILILISIKKDQNDLCWNLTCFIVIFASLVCKFFYPNIRSCKIFEHFQVCISWSCCPLWCTDMPSLVSSVVLGQWYLWSEWKEIYQAPWCCCACNLVHFPPRVDHLTNLSLKSRLLAFDDRPPPGWTPQVKLSPIHFIYQKLFFLTRRSFFC